MSFELSSIGRQAFEAGREVGELGMRVAGALGRTALDGVRASARLAAEVAGDPFDTDWREVRESILREAPRQFLAEMDGAIRQHDSELARFSADLAVRAVTHARESGLAPELVESLAERVEQGTAHVDNLLSDGDPGNPLVDPTEPDSPPPA